MRLMRLVMRVMRRVAGCLPIAILGLSFNLGSAAAQSAPTPSAANPSGAIPNTIKIGLVLPMTGVDAAAGREVSDAAHLYMTQHGDTIDGNKIELIVKDDAGVADNAKRLAQELLVDDKVGFLGAGLTASAMAMAPLVTEAKIPTVVTISGASAVTESSPYYLRTSFTLGQQSEIIADWAVKTGSKKAVMVVSDWAPGAEAGNVFEASFKKAGGQILATLKVPLANPDFSPVLQRAHDLQPDTLFICVPAGQAGALARQFAERGLDKSGIKLVGPGAIVDDDDLPATGDSLVGVVTAGQYSAVHPSQLNKDYVAAYKKATGHRANANSVGGYDGMNLIYQALQKTGGKTAADALIGAIKGMTWESPRGPIAIDPQTRDIVQNIYIRKIEMVSGQPWAIEFKTFPAVKNPLQEAAAR